MLLRQGLRATARAIRQGPGKHDLLPCQRTDGDNGRRGYGPHAGRSQPIDQPPVLRLAEELRDTLADGRTDAGYVAPLLEARLQQPATGASRRGQDLGDVRADMADPQRIEGPRPRGALDRGGRIHDVAGRSVP